jgi:membrane carboxypeptidase/penicillin-binding protein
MPRGASIALKLAALIAGMICVAVAALEATLVQPAIHKARDALALATESERNPPQSILLVLHQVHGPSLASQVARILQALELVQLREACSLYRHLGELALRCLLPLHLSEGQVVAVFLSQSYMGPGVRGFAQASDRYSGVQLEQVSIAQAAELIVISQAPSYYLANPSSLAKRVLAVRGAVAQ